MNDKMYKNYSNYWLKVRVKLEIESCFVQFVDILTKMTKTPDYNK